MVLELELGQTGAAFWLLLSSWPAPLYWSCGVPQPMSSGSLWHPLQLGTPRRMQMPLGPPSFVMQRQPLTTMSPLWGVRRWVTCCRGLHERPKWQALWNKSRGLPLPARTPSKRTAKCSGVCASTVVLVIISPMNSGSGHPAVSVHPPDVLQSFEPPVLFGKRQTDGLPQFVGGFT